MVAYKAFAEDGQDKLVAPKVAGVDRTVDAPSYDIDPAQVQPAVYVYTESCYSKLTQTTKELDEDSQWIVRGNVAAVEFTHLESLPFIKMDFQVEESIKGDLGAGDLISVFRTGGFVSIADVVADRDDGFRYAAIPEDQWATTYHEEVPTGTGYPEVGESFVLFLTTEELFPGAYYPAGDDQGIFKADDQGSYTRVNPIGTYLEADGFPVIDSFTLDELYQYFGG
jgi:hypothetical protein